VSAGLVSPEALIFGLQMAPFWLCSHVNFPLCAGASLCVQTSSYKYTSQTGLGSSVTAHFNLTTSLKSLSPNKVTF
jgi:hypothetical protein